MDLAVADRRPRLGALIDAMLVLVIAALTAACSWAILTQPSVYWVDLIFDDAYYYLGVARNLAGAGTSSFLPPFETNGYQPLWVMLLAATARLFGAGERDLALQLTLLSGIFCVLFAVLSKRYYGRLWPAVLVSAGFPAVMAWGMETVMLPAFALLFFNARTHGARGLFAAALFLARLDALALVVMRDAHRLFVRREKLSTLAHWLVLGPVVVAYFAVNGVWFGSPVPVSGLAKAVGSRFGENIVPLMVFADGAKFVLPLAAVLFALAVRPRGALRLRYGAEMLVSSLALAVCTGYYSLMSGWSIWGWYQWPVLLLAYFLVLEACVLVRAADAPLSGAARVIVLALTATLLLSLAREAAGLFSHYLRSAREIVTPPALLASFGKKNVQLAEEFRGGRFRPGAFIAAGDRAGSLGYFLGNGFRFIHTEGLVGPVDYVKALRADAGAQFVDRLPVDYLVFDRERFFDDGRVIGVAEPVQGWSAHIGPYLLCFDKTGIVARDTYADQTRMVVDYRSRIACPAGFERQFAEQRAQFGGVRQFALPGEFRDGVLKRVLAWTSSDVSRESPTSLSAGSDHPK